MPRKPRSKVVETEKPSSGLLEAVKFVGMACNDIGPVNERHIYLGGHWAAASNGIITIACPIKEDIFACPYIKFLMEALQRSTEFKLHKKENSLQFEANKFKANIPCVDSTLLTIPSPDEAIANITNDLISAFEIAGSLIDENGQEIIDVSFLLNGRSVISSNRAIIFECWHGLDLPKGLSLPKAIIAPLSKSKKKLSKIGGSQSSLTFYFEDESWIKTQLFNKEWPSIDFLLDRPSDPKPLPAGLWEGLSAIAPFSPDGACHFRQGRIQSHAIENAGASYEVPGLPDGLSFTIKQLSLIKPFIHSIDFKPEISMFFGDKIRGALAGRNG